MAEEKRYGLQKVTLVDYPGEVAATIFTSGCNMRCPYCHNAQLAAGETSAAFFSLEQLFDYFEKRKKLLAAVCITGGEPLLDKNINIIANQLYKMGYKIKLDTNGTMPEKILEIPSNYIAMDFKTAPKRYSELGFFAKDSAKKIIKSAQTIIASDKEYEFRTTAMPGIVEANDIKEIVKIIKGAKRYVITQFSPHNTLDPKASLVTPHSINVLKEFLKIATDEGIPTTLRGIN